MSGGFGTDGSVCPAGWRLPTGVEWGNLINLNWTDESQLVPGENGFATGDYTNTSWSDTDPIGFTITNKNDLTQSILLVGYHNASSGYYLSSMERSVWTAQTWRLYFTPDHREGLLAVDFKGTPDQARCVRDPD